VDRSRAEWSKSSLSNVNGCVEVAFVGPYVLVHDSKDRSGLVLVFTAREWETFIWGTRRGEFEIPA
jgi:hypothetical protein